jgi:GNAT superfamily N-acetyltransferase
MTIDTLPASIDGDARIEIAALEDNSLLGTARIENALDRPTLVDLYVDQERREEGIAQRLVEKGMEWARCTGQIIYLYVDPENEKARTLYEKLGWSYFRWEGSSEVNVDRCREGAVDGNGCVWMRWQPSKNEDEGY